MAYEFHYTPTGTGAISGTEVLEQTEDAINDLSNTVISGVQEALDKAELAFTNSANAVDDAQTALNTANNAEGVAIQAQNDVSNLSGTVTNIGNRVTTAEGNIGNLQGRMTTAEGNIGNLQTDVSTAQATANSAQATANSAQATANSAQQTATTARQQSYVVRYASVAVSDNSTVPYTDLNNVDNVKANDLLLDTNGKLYQISSVDTSNETVSVTTPLIGLLSSTDVGAVALSNNYNDLDNLPTIPTKTSDLTNDSGFLTSADCLPIGSYIQFAGSQAPDGFLVCNGGAISRTTYAKLFAVIGTTYGSGDGSTTFNLPNLTDRFLQGSETSGTIKDAGLPNIKGAVEGALGLSVSSGAFSMGNYSSGNVFDTGVRAYHNLSFNASRSDSIYGNSTTVQPPALTCLICIKY